MFICVEKRKLDYFLFRYIYTLIQIYFRIMVSIMDIIIYIWSFIVETATALQHASLTLPEGYGFPRRELKSECRMCKIADFFLR